MRIYLVGYMGCGKSTVGRHLAKALNFGHVDLDVMFEEAYKISIIDFFDKYDEDAFRIIEKKILETTASLQNIVVSTGGGTPCFYDNMDFINKNGISIYIKLNPKSLFHRLSHSKRPRPLASGYDALSLQKSIEERLAQREVFYEQAHLIVKGEDINVEELAHEIKIRFAKF